MPRCQRLKRKHRQVCIGDLDSRIILHDRAIQGISGSDLNINETFTPTTTVWAMAESLNGVTVFDSTNTEIVVTDAFTIRYDATVTAETWVEFDGEYYDIITTEDLDRRKEWMKLLCRLRGPTSSRVNLA